MPIILSSETAHRYPNFFKGLEVSSISIGAELEVIETLNPWIRDFMPIYIEGDFIQFRYDPPYHNIPKYWEPIPTSQYAVSRHSARLKESSIVLDGGAILIDTDNKVVFVSEAFHDEDLKGLFSQYKYKLVFLLPDPDDFTGHLDGIYRIIDGLFLYSSFLDSFTTNEWHLSNVQLLKKLGYQPLAIPDLGTGIDLDTLRGTYMNFLVVGSSILLPRTRTDYPGNLILSSEKAVEECFSKQFGFEPFWVDCQEPTKDGGSLHCLTYSY